MRPYECTILVLVQRSIVKDGFAVIVPNLWSKCFQNSKLLLCGVVY